MKRRLKNILKLSPIALSKNHLYDIQTSKILRKCLFAGSNCIDVGCYKGEILDRILKFAPHGIHYGVEPIPNLYQKLENKYRKYEDCRILNCAASNTEEESSFNYVVSNPSYSGLLKRDYDNPSELDKSIRVRTDLLDNLIPESLKIDLIKIDVEGAELQVLEGAKRIISSYKPIVIFEFGLGASEHYSTTPEKIFNYFSTKGLKVSTLGRFLKKRNSLTLEDLKKNYDERINYYFIGYEE